MKNAVIIPHPENSESKFTPTQSTTFKPPLSNSRITENPTWFIQGNGKNLQPNTRIVRGPSSRRPSSRASCFFGPIDHLAPRANLVMLCVGTSGDRNDAGYVGRRVTLSLGAYDVFTSVNGRKNIRQFSRSRYSANHSEPISSVG